MTRIIYVNGRYLQPDRAMVSFEDRGYQFSDGVYEYIAFYHRTQVDGGAHLDRLERSLAGLHMAMPMSRRALEMVIAETVSRNARDDGGIYLQITRGVSRRDHALPPASVRPALVVAVYPSKLPKPADIASGARVVTSPDLRWARRDIKTVSLLGNVLARDVSVKARARETWMVDEKGFVTEGTSSNAYIVTAGGALVTRQADWSILGGVTRDTVLGVARSAGIAVEERPFTVAEVKGAAEAFLTSTSANVLPVVQIDGEKIGAGRSGPVTLGLLAAYHEHITRQTGKVFA